MGRYEGENLDVICQHCHTGKVIPMRIRVTEDGETHIVVFGQMKTVRLYFNKNRVEWTIKA
ncbi:MAG: hypothetical protein E7271_02665 [Lachnospiraceae bacterium]|nr:hypothetical protein [Lachnospiraceae bacterium]